MTFYQKHVFVCTNQKSPGKVCCAQSGGELFFEYLQAKLKQLNLYGAGKIRVTRSGCLGRCKFGPCLVVYPESIWYTYSDFSDLDEIIHGHLSQGNIVKRLLIDVEPSLGA